MAETFPEVLDAFHEVMNDVAGTHAMSFVGLIMVSEWSEDPQNQPPSIGPDSMLFIGHGDPNVDGFHYQRWAWETLPDRLGPDGPVMRDLGQQWLVMVVAQWNENFRKRFAEAKGLASADDMKDPVFGDLNKMRNDVVHHGGIASARNTGKCTELDWFAPGEPIHVMPAHVAHFMDYLGLKAPASEIDGDVNVRDIGPD